MTEREILQILYSDYNGSRIQKKEDPDFYLLHEKGHQFGVEVTRYFHSESSARLKYIPNYGVDLINGKSYKHKDDKIELPIEDMIIKSSNGTERKIKGIFHYGKSLSVISNNIASVIKNKNKKFETYYKNLTHINLLIYDLENCFQSMTKKSFYKLFMTEPIIKQAENSSFREIFFITKDQDNNINYIPVRLFQISSHIVSFRKIFINYSNLYGVDKTINNYFKDLIKYLSYLNNNSIRYKYANNSYYIYFGNSAFTVENNKYKLNLLWDDKLPNDIKQVNTKNEKYSFDKKYIPIINEFYSETIGYLDLLIKTKKAI